MIKITLIAPYEEMIDIAAKAFNELKEHETLHITSSGRVEYSMDCFTVSANDAPKYKVESDVIIARGLTAEILKNRDDYIPVVEIPITGIDILTCLTESKAKSMNKKIAIVGSKTFTIGIREFSELLNIDIKPYTYVNYSEYPRMVNQALTEGREVIIGGAEICEYAEKLGLSSVLLKSGKEALWQAISEAKRVAFISRVEQEKAQLFKTILDYAYEGIIAIDQKGIITAFNSTARKTLRTECRKLSGMKVEEIIPKSNIRDLLVDDGEHLDEIIKHNNMQLAVNKVPIMLKGENVGNVITFQNATKIQEIEGKIRERIYTHGHVAKHTFTDIEGESSKIRGAIDTAKSFSQTDLNILIMGETGTGKELFAQSIHNSSPRKKGPFVAVNCAALPENLLESELFGYVEGAFTGAAKGGKPGLFELAHKGTIFLDEIAELPPRLQGRLLRVIQEKEIMRLGHDRVIPVDVRVITATNKNLFDMVNEKCFRQDLYYRLDVLSINLPSLRERKEDIPLIVDRFMASTGDKKIADKAKSVLMEHEWPGNIRELKNICERLSALSHSNIIDVAELRTILPLNIQMGFGFINDKINAHNDGKQFLAESHNYPAAGSAGNFTASSGIFGADADKNLERKRIQQLMEQEGYKKAMVAKRLGIDRTTLWRKMKELNMI